MPEKPERGDWWKNGGEPPAWNPRDDQRFENEQRKHRPEEDHQDHWWQRGEKPPWEK